MCDARRVLVVEDIPALRHLLAQALTGEGFAVWTARHGAEALATLEEADPCLILLDLRMPVLDGFAFGRAYRAREDAEARIVVMTAEAQPGDLAAIGPAQVVPKPFDLEELVLVVERWVQAHTPLPS
jgi:CheY-like chemotaxis protein